MTIAVDSEKAAVPVVRPAPGAARGALVVGGDHPGLAVARSLGRHGIPVYVIDDQPCISRFSRYAKRVIRVSDILDERKTVDNVLEVGRRFNLRDWVLIATRDETVAAFSRYRDELAAFFSVTTGEWDSVQWAWDKKKSYDLTESLDIPCPKTFNLKSADELPSLYSRLPLTVKPMVRRELFSTLPAQRPDAVIPRATASELRTGCPPDSHGRDSDPGKSFQGGSEQFSWCAFVRNGQPHSTLTALRLRQHPRKFGRAAAYVETVEAPAIEEELSERFVRRYWLPWSGR